MEWVTREASAAGEGTARVAAFYRLGQTPEAGARGLPGGRTGSRAGSLTAAADAKSPPPLPVVLKEATPTTRIVYLYLEPYGEVQVTVVQLEERLGISHRPAFEALRDLRKFSLVSLSPNARGRPRGSSRRSDTL